MRHLGSLRAIGALVAAVLFLLLAIAVSIRVELLGQVYCGVREAQTPSR